MTTKLILKKATHLEGNADIHTEFDRNRLTSARCQVLEFRGFEKFVGGRRAEWVPYMISRICGLCSTAHQVAGGRAIKNAIGIEADVPLSRSFLENGFLAAPEIRQLDISRTLMEGTVTHHSRELRRLPVPGNILGGQANRNHPVAGPLFELRHPLTECR